MLGHAGIHNTIPSLKVSNSKQVSSNIVSNVSMPAEETKEEGIMQKTLNT